MQLAHVVQEPTARQPSLVAATPAADEGSAWRGAFQDLPREHGFEPLRVEGALPNDLAGTLHRAGPSRFSRFGAPYRHWFDGDGAISAVRFAGGRAEGAVRFVESEGWKKECAAGKALYGGYGTPAPGGFFSRFAHRLPKNAANTSVVMWQGRLFGLFEGGLPTELDPETLHTLGERDFEGVVPQTFSAHAHWVTERAAAYNFGVRYGRKTLLDLFELPASGPARRLASVPLSGPTMIHDFIATPKHLVFFAPPLRLSILPTLLGMKSYSDNLRWAPEVGTEVLVVPIDDPSAPIRFTAPAFYQWHFGNAFERDGHIVLDLVEYPDFETNNWLGEVARGLPSSEASGRFVRATLDLQSKRLTREALGDVSVEFPRVASTVLGQPHRHSYMAAHSSPAAAARGLYDELAHHDHHTGAFERVSLGRGQYPSEAVFVRREGGAAEDDGYLLSLVYDAPTHTSHVAVLDARRLKDGPVARVHFDHHVPFTFHGNWSSARR